MSQSSKHVEWCLNKAKKEIEECKKLGKRQKYRGLLKSNPNLEEAKKHLAKAEHDFEGITKFKEIGFSDWSMSAGFYCIYHCFLAILTRFGYESRNQECTIATIEMLKENKEIDIDDRLIDSLKINKAEEMHESSIIRIRENFQYGVELEFKEEFDNLVNLCKEAINKTREIVH